MMVHRNAAVKAPKNVKKTYPVNTTRVHEWLKGYLGNPNVEWLSGTSLIIWNSPAHKKAMSQ
jgi:hypothetical protein